VPHGRAATTIESRLAAEAAALESGGLRRERVARGARGICAAAGQPPLVNFCSNDYLGLSRHPAVIESFARAAREYGVGSGGSSVVCGYTDAHAALETALARYTGREAAVVFASGYMANVAVIATMARPGGALLVDRLAHASIIDGALLSRARLQRYRHCDLDDLERRLSRSSATARLVVTEGMFSMEGDLAPVRGLSEVAMQHDAVLVVDDAHGVGVLGEHGGGLLELLALGADEVPLLVGTFGKALGGAGAFVAGTRVVVDALAQRARPYLYSTAMPPALAAAMLTALECSRAESWRRLHLRGLVERFVTRAQRVGLPLRRSETPIQPVMLGSNARACAVSAFLRARGFHVVAIRPPTVPRNTARLRVTITAAHTEAEIDALVAALAAAMGSVAQAQPLR
jgi:8-amino-7-oxononanoate synthase